jgi:hypothetical protein
MRQGGGKREHDTGWQVMGSHQSRLRLDIVVEAPEIYPGINSGSRGRSRRRCRQRRAETHPRTKVLRRLVQRLAVAEAAKRRRRLQATLLFLFNGISIANSAVASGVGPFLFSLCGVPSDGLFDLEEGVVGEGA